MRAETAASILMVAAISVRADIVPVAEPAPPGKSPWWSLSDSSLMQSLGVNSWADVFVPGRWDMSVDLEGDGNLQTTQSPGTPQANFSSRLFREGISISNRGLSLIDARLLTMDVGVRFALDQGHQDAAGSSFSESGNVTDYFLYGSVLQEKPFNGNFLATRAETITSQPGGGSTRTQSSGEGAILNWREDSFLRDKGMPYFSSTLQVGQYDTQQVTTNAGQSFRRDEHREVMRLDGHNGFLNGDLYFRAEDTDLQNRLYPAGSYQSRYANVNYSFDFGPNLDRHSTSNLNYSERSGDLGISNLAFEEQVTLLHSNYLSSNYDYTMLWSNGPAGTVDSQQGDVGVQYTPYANLSTSANAFATRLTFPTGTISSVGVSSNADYGNGLPWGGQMTLNLGGSTQQNESQLQSSQVPVMEAPYRAPPALGANTGFELKDSYIVTDSIVVVDVRDNGSYPTAEGVDYIVVVEGSRTSIVPLATSAVIMPNDPLAVSYYYLVDPSLKSRSTSSSVFLLADWHWINLSASHSATKQTPLSGQQTTLLSDQNRDELRLGLLGDWGAYTARGDAIASRIRDTHLSYDQYRLVELLTYRPSYYWLVTLSGTQSDTRYVLDSRHTRQDDIRLGTSWTSVTGWWLNAYLEYRALQDTEIPPERVIDSVIQVRRRWSKLDLSAALGFGETTRGSVQTRYADIHFSAVRRF